MGFISSVITLNLSNGDKKLVAASSTLGQAPFRATRAPDQDLHEGIEGNGDGDGDDGVH